MATLTELEALATTVEPGAVTTVIGPGGIGKTTLAAEWIADNGGCWVELADVTADELLPARIAAAAGVGPSASRAPFEELARQLQPVTETIVLDNCEHLLPAVQRLLKACVGARNITWIATSRSAIGVRNEKPLHLGPLSDDDAEELWHKTVGAWSPNKQQIDTEVLETLDGHPLAIEIAARLATLEGDWSPGTESLTNLMFGTAVTTHHQSIEDSFEASYQRLTKDGQWAFRQLSILAGSFDLSDSEDVLEEPPEMVSACVDELVRHSLLSLTRDGLRFLEPVRRFAEKKCIEAGEHEARRSSYALRLRHNWMANGEDWLMSHDAYRALTAKRSRVDLTLQIARQSGDVGLEADLAFLASSLWLLGTESVPGIDNLENALASESLTDLQRLRALHSRSLCLLNRVSVNEMLINAENARQLAETFPKSPAVPARAFAMALLAGADSSVTDQIEQLQQECHDYVGPEDRCSASLSESFIHLGFGDFAAAFEASTRAWESGEECERVQIWQVMAWMTRASTLLYLNRPDEAAVDIDRYLDLDRHTGTETVHMAIRAAVLAAVGDPSARETMVEHARAVINLDRVTILPEALLGLACVEHFDGNTELAKNLMIDVVVTKYPHANALATWLRELIGVEPLTPEKAIEWALNGDDENFYLDRLAEARARLSDYLELIEQ